MAEVHKRKRRANREIRRALSARTAREAIGAITPGCEIFGVTKGQFSLIDIIEHVVGATGPVDVVLSTWTAAAADLGFAMGLISDGRIRSLRFVVDFSFPRRQPEYCAALRERFGDDAVRLTKSHAKFVVLRNEAWNVVIRSSMNLNENKRLESFEVSDDPGMATYLVELCQTLFDDHAPGAQFDQSPGQNVREFNSWFGDDVHSRDIRRAGWTQQKTGKTIQ